MSDIVVANQSVIAAWTEDREALEIVKGTVASGLSDMEFRFFLAVCKRTGLDPLAKQIYAIKRNQWENGQTVQKMTIQTGIDGFRLIAERTGKYSGQRGPFWCGADGEWRDYWVADGPPAAAKVGVMRHDFSEPIWAVAHFREYVQESKDKSSGRMVPTSMWRKMPANQLAKVAEALALRRAFPQEMSGIYTQDEMDQADSRESSIDAARNVAEEKLAALRNAPPEHSRTIDIPRATPAPPAAPDAHAGVTTDLLRSLEKAFADADKFKRRNLLKSLRAQIGGEAPYRHVLKHGFNADKSTEIEGGPEHVKFYHSLLEVYQRYAAVQSLIQRLHPQTASDICKEMIGDSETWMCDRDTTAALFKALAAAVKAQENAKEDQGQ